MIGELADRRLSDSLLRIAEAASPTSKANGVLTVQLALDQILAALSLEFDDARRVPEVEAAVMEIKRQIKVAHPDVVSLFIKPQTSAAFKENVRNGFETLPPATTIVQKSDTTLVCRYLTSSTGVPEVASTRCATEPIRTSRMAPRPFAPSTIKSYFPLSAQATISCAT